MPEITSTPHAEDLPESQPALDAFAHAIAMTAQQHQAATPEDAPSEPVQARLPIPRPPFDADAALERIFAKEAEVEALAEDYEIAKKEAADWRKQWETGAKELAAMIRQYRGEKHEREREAAWTRDDERTREALLPDMDVALEAIATWSDADVREIEAYADRYEAWRASSDGREMPIIPGLLRRYFGTEEAQV